MNKRILAYAVIILSVVYFYSSDAVAQIKSIPEYGDSGNYFIAIRCAGVNGAIASYLGEERLGSKYRHFEKTIALFTQIAILSAKDQGLDDSQAQNNVSKDIINAIKLYRERFSKNFVESASAFADDELVQTDVGFCREILEPTGQ